MIMGTLSAQIKKEWLYSSLVWSGVILLLTAINSVHDLLVTPEHRFNNHPFWALQEWAIWYLLTPISFRLLNQLHKQKTSSYILIFVVIFCCSMSYQAIFDLFFYHDVIPSTLVYFAPSHLMVIGVIMAVWHHFMNQHTPPVAETLLVDSGKDKVLLPLNDIIHINSASNYVEVFTSDKTYLKRATLKGVERRLPSKQFIRTHRCHLINLNHVERLQTSPTGSVTIMMKNGQPINLSKTYRRHVKQLCNAA
ncbi:LytTR family transcriptional regulator [Pseudoalteromonas aurantia]|uniref:LytTR family transcriptional regulator n=2 Tax=Pseudoalteromonas aurantia TaxID=43654 RepID=A0A5S3V9L5_9GAMM|nr:LytTR family transcriptional regulator [Pseudoalteromonas aurantia]TMO68583.1 LytTR family transcriptional regulator [Pseudoalteromonas aurantia]TMO72793.1 LytTR family transcriptional regulator [Pseudoalteromonas aurantia]